MAVQKMKLVSISGQLDHFDQIVGCCVMNRAFHPEYAMDIMQQTKVLHKMDEPNPYSEKLRRITTIAEQLGIPLSFRNFSESEMSNTHLSETCEMLSENVNRMKQERERLLRIAIENEQIIKQLDHIRDVEFDLHDFFLLVYAKFRFGRLPREVYDHYLEDFERSNLFFFFPTSIEKDYVYGMILTTRVNEDQTDALFAAYRFERIYISDKVHGSSDQAKQRLSEEIERSRTEAENLKHVSEQLITAETNSVLSYYSYLRFKSETFDLRKYAVQSDTSFFLYGWVPEDTVNEFTKNLEQFSNIFYSIDEPQNIRDMEPPVILKNARIFKPFEPFVEMYGKPSYYEIDPTPFMAILYTLFFGIMFGDVGQGLLVAGIGLLMWRLKKMWLGRIMIYAGLSGTAFGFVYGSVFGFENLLPFGFKVLESGENTSAMLQTAVYIGVLIILLVMVLNVINGLKKREYEKALFSQNGIAGICLYLSVMVLVLPMLGFLPIGPIPSAVLLPAFLIPLTAVIFRHPLGKLVSGDKHWLPDSLVDFLLENVFELIEVLLSFIANTVSFLRIGIFALSHAGMMMVVFLLAGDSQNPVVILIGNLVVMGIEGLLVGIQVLRLNFYEMFGRFFTAEGRAFHPVMIDYQTIQD